MKGTRKNADVEAANEIYQVAQAEANQKLLALQEEVEDIRQESFALGTIRAMDSVKAYSELMKYVSLYRIKKHKEYRAGGLTWDGFCESLGLERRNVDRILEDISPLMSDFSDKVHMISNIPFNKIRHLGRQISGQLSVFENGAITYDGETIPITPENADEIQALIERIDEDARKAKDDAEADIKAKDRVLKAKEDVIKKQEKELAKLDKSARKHGLTAEEDAFCQRMLNARTIIDGFLMDFDPDRSPLPESATPRMRAAYMETLGYLKRAMDAAFDTAADSYGDPELDDSWIPPHLRKKEDSHAATTGYDPASSECKECRSVAPEKCAGKCCNNCATRCHNQVVCFREAQND